LLQIFGGVMWFFVCSPVYPEEEAEDENVVDDSGAAELTLDKIEDDAILVILFIILLNVVVLA